MGTGRGLGFEMTAIVFLPFAGTMLGAGCIVLAKCGPHPALQENLTGFAAGVMTAAAVWSLLIPAIGQSDNMGIFSFVPALVGFLAGMLFLLLLDHRMPHWNPCKDRTDNGGTDRGMADNDRAEESGGMLRRTTMMIFAITLHNIPEGMAVGAVCAGLYSGAEGISLSGIWILALGIAVQNVPEGAIISMPLMAVGVGKGRSFWYGILSGIVEPAGALLTVLAASFFAPLLPYFLSFAAGAMIFVVVEELIPKMSQGSHADVGTIFYALGFALMMVLDVALG